MRIYPSSLIPNIMMFKENERERASLNDDILQRHSECCNFSLFSLAYLKARFLSFCQYSMGQSYVFAFSFLSGSLPGVVYAMLVD
jgi:hypothetical protein